MKPIIRLPLSPVLVVFVLFLATTLHATSSSENEEFEVDDDSDEEDAYAELDWDKLQLVSSGSGDFEEPEHTVSEALGYLMKYHGKALFLEKSYKHMEDYEVHSERQKKANQEGRDSIDKLGKLSDQLESLMVDVKNGKLSSDQYKSELIEVDRQKKRLDMLFDVFSDNITDIKGHWIDFAQDWNLNERDFRLFIEFGKGEITSLVDIARNASVRLIDTEDNAITGFAGGKEIDFDISVMEELKEKFEELEKLEDRETTDPKVFMKMIEEIENYRDTVIDVFLKANKKQLGRFLPSLGAAMVRVRLNNMIATNLREVWEKNQEVEKQIIMEMAAAEERYRKILLETAVLLKSVLKDEL